MFFTADKGHYLRHRSFPFDMKILWLTFIKVIKLEGAQRLGERMKKALKNNASHRARSTQRKAGYACVQNYERAQFCSHFMPLPGQK